MSNREWEEPADKYAPHLPEDNEEAQSLEEYKKGKENHPWMLAKTILDNEFELTIEYSKDNVTDAYLVEGDMPRIEAILTDENEGALITNDLSIIEITPDVNTVVLAKEKLDMGMQFLSGLDGEKSFTILEYNRVKPAETVAE